MLTPCLLKLTKYCKVKVMCIPIFAEAIWNFGLSYAATKSIDIISVIKMEMPPLNEALSATNAQVNSCILIYEKIIRKNIGATDQKVVLL